MKTAIVSYDLKNVASGANLRVKRALKESTNAHFTAEGLNTSSRVPSWATVNLPDTTLLINDVSPQVTAGQLADEVIKIIKSQDADPARVYVAFISEDDCVVNLE